MRTPVTTTYCRILCVQAAVFALSAVISAAGFGQESTAATVAKELVQKTFRDADARYAPHTHNRFGSRPGADDSVRLTDLRLISRIGVRAPRTAAMTPRPTATAATMAVVGRG